MSGFEFIRTEAREKVPDWYASALLAPFDMRNDLIVLASYLGNVSRIPLTISDPVLAEIRLQWWRDTLSAGAQGGLSGNPIADELVRTISRHELAMDDVLAPLDARSFELYDIETADDGQRLFDAYLDDTEGAAARLAAQILATAKITQPLVYADVTRPYALIRTAVRLPRLLALGRWPVPTQYSSGRDPRLLPEPEARAVIRYTTAALVKEALEAPKAPVSQATLPAALTRSYARALLNPRRDALRQPADIAPLTRLARLWIASFQSQK